jgi:hypothetical protein
MVARPANHNVLVTDEFLMASEQRSESVLTQMVAAAMRPSRPQACP